jgi:hypothetical protein
MAGLSFTMVGASGPKSFGTPNRCRETSANAGSSDMVSIHASPVAVQESLAFIPMSGS